MPNGTKEPREYGAHQYDDDGTSDCHYRCGCWTGPCRSGGPQGIDPFGECPNNPVGAERLEGDRDYRNVIERRIEKLESLVSELRQQEYAAKLAQTKGVATDHLALAASLAPVTTFLIRVHKIPAGVKWTEADLTAWQAAVEALDNYLRA